MEDQELGRVPSEPGSREPSPSVSAASGFDPSRIDPHKLGMARIGECVRFLGKNGYPFELNEANVCFEVGQVLTVAEINIGGWSGTYRFEGAGEATWNTVMFEPCDNDGSPEGGDGEAGSIAEGGDSAGRRHRPTAPTILTQEEKGK